MADEGFQQKLAATANRLGVRPDRLPRHIAIIMDGNGRWAQKRGLPRPLGHAEGAKTAEKIARHCVNLGIEVLTLYSFSLDNWKRPASEVNALMGLYQQYLANMRPALIEQNVKVVHLGRKEQLPEPVRQELERTLQATSSNNGMTLALALNYGGRAEIVDAVRSIVTKALNGQLTADQIDQACISQHLYTAGLPDPDLLIRTANELRISDFLLWQISYSEFYVTATLWPDFDEAALEQALIAYASRERRFGGLSPKSDP
ncbi:MAG: isoprenyl transferase [Sedimentisphaerales bacterium]|jgi:undecaprenyl diphosphate synthase|nr:isoprenyl transferase [Sedimentisphaerales bacterium]